MIDRKNLNDGLIPSENARKEHHVTARIAPAVAQARCFAEKTTYIP